jgi:pyruvate,water dikinase
MAHTIEFKHLGMRDLPQVGGKNASLGEMISCLQSKGISVPTGFATTADSFREFLLQNNLDKTIYDKLAKLNIDNLTQLTKAGEQIRTSIINTPFTQAFIDSVTEAYALLAETIGHKQFTVAVRSSATAEDLPDASFAGQQETYLNVHGIDGVLAAIKDVYASLFNDRAITYRVHNNFAHAEVAISAGVQQMVRSDLGASGVLFTLDTESGFNEVVFITSSYGLGELVVQGAVNPDEFYVHKPGLRAGRPAVIRRTLGTKAIKMVYSDGASHDKRVKTLDVDLDARLCFSLTTAEVEELARQALIIEEHYGCPMDVEWGKDGQDGKLYILQARPETVKSRQNHLKQERYTLSARGPVLAEGRSIGQRIGQGCAKVIKDLREMDRIKPGDVLVTDMTDPDWEPVMKRASAIVTNRGGRTCHAAIIARELGLPAVVGCGDATKTITDGEIITVSCAEGDTGYVYQGSLPFEHTQFDREHLPDLPLTVMLNVGNPERAFAFQAVPNGGVGLARLEFLISNTIGIHPKALLEFDSLEDKELKKLITERTMAYASPVDFYVERLKEGIATIAAAFYPKKVIVRLSDFKSNEYANLAGGKYFEPHEENPMLGFRGASRYVSPEFEDCFALECQAVRAVREEMGFTNVEVMIPFVRTVKEAGLVIDVLKKYGLERGREGLRMIMMCELPSNALLADEFLHYFDGFSIGSNDLTQLTLGLDRDSGLVAAQFDERNDAVKALLHLAISACKKAKKYIGICGQGPSDHPDFAEWLMKEGIDSVSLNPDSVWDTCAFLAKHSK